MCANVSSLSLSFVEVALYTLCVPWPTLWTTPIALAWSVGAGGVSWSGGLRSARRRPHHYRWQLQLPPRLRSQPRFQHEGLIQQDGRHRQLRRRHRVLQHTPCFRFKDHLKDRMRRLRLLQQKDRLLQLQDRLLRSRLRQQPGRLLPSLLLHQKGRLQGWCV